MRRFITTFIAVTGLLCTLANAQLPSFTQAAVILPGVDDGACVWGDYDGDGDLDFALAGNQNDDSLYAEIWRNDGNGTFTPISAGLPGVNAASLAWGDYDRDGDLDLALCGWTAPSPIASIFRNDGNDTFTDIGAGLYGAGGAWNGPDLKAAIAWLDHDSDGDLDLIVAGWDGSIPRTTLWENQNGSFTEASDGLADVMACGISVGDLNADGRPDLVLMGLTTTGYDEVTIVYENTGGGFSQAATLPPVYGGGFALGDYDSDGLTDIALCGWNYDGTTTTGLLEVYKNMGGFTFVSINANMTPIGGGWLEWADMDNDGDLDLMALGDTIIGLGVASSPIYRNDGGGVFVGETPPWAFINSGVGHGGMLSLGDYDADGDLDVLLCGDSNSSDPTGAVSAIFNNNSTVANNAPAPPTSLASSVSNGLVTLSWTMGMDSETPAAGLAYNLRVGTFPGGNDIVSGMSLADGTRLIPDWGNAGQTLSVTLPETTPLYWSVQTIDGGRKASSWAPEQAVGAFVVLMDQPNGPSSFRIRNLGGTPNVEFFTPISLLPQNAVSTGPIFGLHLSLDDLIAEYTWPGLPFRGVYDSSGTSEWTVPGGVPAGLTLWAVTIELDAFGFGLPVRTTPVVSITTL